MPFEINNLGSFPADLKYLRVVLQRALHFLKFSKKSRSFSLALVNNQTIKRLNRIYRGINQVTDVLAYELQPAVNHKTDELVDAKPYFGEIIISFPQAKKQAKQNHRPIKKEIGLLAVHGLLHLAGFDHKTEQDRKRMESWQDKILG